MVNTKDFYDREFGEEKPDEGCMWEEPTCPLSSVYKSDMYKIGSVAPKAPEVKVPWLLIHGDAGDLPAAILRILRQERLDVLRPIEVPGIRLERVTDPLDVRAVAVGEVLQVVHPLVLTPGIEHLTAMPAPAQHALDEGAEPFRRWWEGRTPLRFDRSQETDRRILAGHSGAAARLKGV